MAEIYQLPENGNNNSGVGNIPFSIPIGGFGFNNGFGGGGFGYGMNGIYDPAPAAGLVPAASDPDFIRKDAFN